MAEWLRSEGFPAHAGMDPRPWAGSTSPGRFPRTRGDGPPPPRPIGHGFQVSPHTRGWTPAPRLDVAEDVGFPAHAGMDRSFGPTSHASARFPRTRGDGPAPYPPGAAAPSVSPHTRGWTRGAEAAPAGHLGFPAHAGMDPRRSGRHASGAWFPRTRGDGPCARPGSAAGRWVSPHTRGWTPTARCRGCAARGFPAHAGMDPSEQRWLPTTRRFPRTRGDGPKAKREIEDGVKVSPHTRGWTRRAYPLHTSRSGFPAHAGMDPRLRLDRRPDPGFPRTRGDGPVLPYQPAGPCSVSPHTRGWTPAEPALLAGTRGFPAHAGMDPCGPAPAPTATRFPRTRGDGPVLDQKEAEKPAVSPHTRGWTLDAGGRVDADAGFPAHAGMDPA